MENNQTPFDAMTVVEKATLSPELLAIQQKVERSERISDDDALHLIFRPGFSTKKRGWGLGLSLAKRIVEEYHGGKIYIKESSPQGTTFCIRLDLAAPPETKPDKQNAPREHAEA